MLFTKKIEPSCSYCKRGKSADADTILCTKHGICSPASSCRAFRYDPLKRTPPRPMPPDFSRLKEEDFML